MSKLTKSQAKLHRQACDLISSSSPLTYDEKLFVLSNWNESANHINSVSGAFFTPPSLASDLSIYVGDGPLIDLCAGIGTLAFHCIDQWRSRPELPYTRHRLVCVEINPDYVAVGRRVVPEAEWICTDIFDLDISSLGIFSYAISNPPFGKAKNLPIPGTTIDLNVVAIASQIARHGVFILPQESCPFKYSGRQGYEPYESKPFRKLVSSGVDISLLCSSIDCTVHRDDWNGVTPNVEIAYYDLYEQTLESEYEVDEMKTKPGTVLHSSLSPFVNSSSNFPRADRRIGVIARETTHHPPGPCTIEVEWEGPSFISTCAGEYVDPDDADGVVRKKLLELARDCRTVAKELIEHAYRLEQTAGQETVIAEADEESGERREEAGDGEIETVYENRGPEKVSFRGPSLPTLSSSKGKEIDADEL